MAPRRRDDDFRRAYRTARGGGYGGTKAEFQRFVQRAPALFRPEVVAAASEWEPARRGPPQGPPDALV